MLFQMESLTTITPSPPNVASEANVPPISGMASIVPRRLAFAEDALVAAMRKAATNANGDDHESKAAVHATPGKGRKKAPIHNIISYLTHPDMFRLALSTKLFGELVRDKWEEFQLYQWTEESRSGEYAYLGRFCSGEICRCGVEHCGLMHSKIHGIELENEEDQTEFDTLPLDELRRLGSNDDDNSSQGDCSCYGMTSLEIWARERESLKS